MAQLLTLEQISEHLDWLRTYRWDGDPSECELDSLALEMLGTVKTTDEVEDWLAEM